MILGSSFRGLFTRVLTHTASSHASGQGRRSSWPPRPGSSQVPQSVGSRITGMRSCCSAMSAFASVVIIVQVVTTSPVSGSVQTSHKPARPRGYPAGRQTFALGGGQIFNIGSGVLRLTCPIVEISRLGNAQIRVVDLSSTANVGCSLRTVRNEGTQLQAQTIQSVGASSAVQVLNYGAQASPGQGYYVIDCTLPPFVPGVGGSSVVMYSIVEQ
jgi:hypothetical protein